jgi:hypothetical protein
VRAPGQILNYLHERLLLRMFGHPGLEDALEVKGLDVEVGELAGLKQRHCTAGDLGCCPEVEVRSLHGSSTVYYKRIYACMR